MQRCAMPSPPQTKNCSAPCSSSRLTCLGAFLLFGTSTHSGSVDSRGHSSVRRSCGSPPSMVFPAWAITAMRGHSASSFPAAAARTPARVAAEATQQRADADQQPGGHVGGVVHAAIHPSECHQQRDGDRDRPARHLKPAAVDGARDHEGDAAVDGNRCCGVTREVAGVDGQIVEPRHVGALAVDHERGDAVGGRLDADRGQDEPCHPPVTRYRGDDRSDRDQRWDGVHVADSREPVGHVVSRRGAMLREPDVDVLVGVADAMVGQHVGLQHPPERDRERGENCEADKYHNEVRDQRVARKPDTVMRVCLES